MKTAEGVTPAPGLGYALIGFLSMYAILAAICITLLLRMATGAPPELLEEEDGPNDNGPRNPRVPEENEEKEMLREGNFR
jgi:cytochrome bd-type quinol oxidase subunit 1